MTKRLAIYAAYDAQKQADAADIAYLQALQPVAENIIYVADNELLAAEADKLRGLCRHIIAAPHGEYDFGSYKRGFVWAEAAGLLQDVDELIFCNDSCFAPFAEFAPIFAAMSERNCDFWGLTENPAFYPHIQSFFLVLRPQVFNSEVFHRFINGICRQQNVDDVIQNYEIGLSRLLHEAGFASASYIAYPHPPKKHSNLTAHPIWLIKQGCPLLKKKALRLAEANMEGIWPTYFFVRRYKNVPVSRQDVVLSTGIKCFARRIARFFFCRKTTKSRKLLIKICKIPVYCRRLPEDRP